MTRQMTLPTRSIQAPGVIEGQFKHRPVRLIWSHQAMRLGGRVPNRLQSSACIRGSKTICGQTSTHGQSEGFPTLQGVGWAMFCRQNPTCKLGLFPASSQDSEALTVPGNGSLPTADVKTLSGLPGKSTIPPALSSVPCAAFC